MLKGIIFDFDGVVAESVQVKTDAFATLYKPYGNTIVNKVIKHHEENGGMSRFEKIKYYHKYFINKTISGNELYNLSQKFSDLVVDGVIKSPYVDGVLNFIKKKSIKYKLFVSTATPETEINTIIKAKKIERYFTSIYGAPSTKYNHIDLIMSKYRLNNDELIFYGDSEADYCAAYDKNIKFVLVRNKYNKLFRKKYNGRSISSFKDN